MTMKEQAEARRAELRAMKAGDYVHNVPHSKFGIILEDIGASDYDRTTDGRPERVFMVVWDDGTVHAAGDTFLSLEVSA